MMWHSHHRHVSKTKKRATENTKYLLLTSSSGRKPRLWLKRVKYVHKANLVSWPVWMMHKPGKLQGTFYPKATINTERNCSITHKLTTCCTTSKRMQPHWSQECTDDDNVTLIYAPCKRSLSTVYSQLTLKLNYNNLLPKDTERAELSGKSLTLHPTVFIRLKCYHSTRG